MINPEDFFKNPDHIKRAHVIVNAFNQSEADGHNLYNQLKELCLLESEWLFEEEIKDHPHGLEIKFLQSGGDADIFGWLSKTFHASEYIMMPRNASGKYKDKWNWIYFKKPCQAVLFKLRWL